MLTSHPSRRMGPIPSGPAQMSRREYTASSGPKPTIFAPAVQLRPVSPQCSGEGIDSRGWSARSLCCALRMTDPADSQGRTPRIARVREPARHHSQLLWVAPAALRLRALREGNRSSTTSGTTHTRCRTWPAGHPTRWTTCGEPTKDFVPRHRPDTTGAEHERPARSLRGRARAAFLPLLLVMSTAATLLVGDSPAGRLPRAEAGNVGSSTLEHLIFIVQENRSFDHYFGTFPGRTASSGCGRQHQGVRAEPVQGPVLPSLPHLEPPVAWGSARSQGIEDRHRPGAHERVHPSPAEAADRVLGAPSGSRLPNVRRPEGATRRRELSHDEGDPELLDLCPEVRPAGPPVRSRRLLDAALAPVPHVRVVGLVRWIGTTPTPADPTSTCRTRVSGGHTPSPPSTRGPTSRTCSTPQASRGATTWTPRRVGSALLRGSQRRDAGQQESCRGIHGCVGIGQRPPRQHPPQLGLRLGCEGRPAPLRVVARSRAPAYSEHPGGGSGSIRDGMAYVTRLVNAVMSGPDWETSAIFVTWDHWEASTTTSSLRSPIATATG